MMQEAKLPDIDVFIKQAGSFREPGQFVTMLEGYRAGITQDDLFNRPRYKPLQDAWQAGLLALGYQENRRQLAEVRLVDPGDQFPDFQVRTNGSVSDFEATMVQLPGTKLGDEYKGVMERGGPQTEKPVVLPEFEPNGLKEAIRLKADKHYSTSPHLCVFLNTRGRQVGAAQMIEWADIPEAQAFKSIWVIAGKYYLMCARPSADLGPLDQWFQIPVIGDPPERGS